MFVQCDDVMKLRELMDAYGQITGLTNEERDPEEFLTSLFQQVMKMDPLLKLTSGDVNWYTLFVEKDQMNLIPTVQQLFDESLVASDVRLREVGLVSILRQALQEPRHVRVSHIGALDYLAREEGRQKAFFLAFLPQDQSIRWAHNP